MALWRLDKHCKLIIFCNVAYRASYLKIMPTLFTNKSIKATRTQQRYCRVYQGVGIIHDNEDIFTVKTAFIM